MSRHKSVIDGTDFSAREYVVNKDGETIYRPLPMIKLSYDEPTPSVFFTDGMIHSASFSQDFKSFYQTQISNLVVPFVDPPDTCYDGPRFLPIKFSINKRPCIKSKFTFSDPTMLYHIGLYIDEKRLDPFSGAARQAETRAINELTPDLPRTTNNGFALGVPVLKNGTRHLCSTHSSQNNGSIHTRIRHGFIRTLRCTTDT